MEISRNCIVWWLLLHTLTPQRTLDVRLGDGARGTEEEPHPYQISFPFQLRRFIIGSWRTSSG